MNEEFAKNTIRYKCRGKQLALGWRFGVTSKMFKEMFFA